MFNRVGNLTVLSLRKEINQIIEEYCGSKASGDQLNDISTIRIYWKYFNSVEDEEMKQEEIVNEQQADTKKTFYLYTNNTIRELVYDDLEALLPYVSLRVKEKVNLGLHYMSQKPEKLREVSLLRKQLNREPMNQQGK